MLESLFNKNAGLAFIKESLQHSCFSVKVAKFLRTPILKNICERLLLLIYFRSFFIEIKFSNIFGHNALLKETSEENYENLSVRLSSVLILLVQGLFSTESCQKFAFGAVACEYAKYFYKSLLDLLQADQMT